MRNPKEFVSDVSLEVGFRENTDWRRESGLLITGERNVPDEAVKRIWGDEERFRLFLSHVSKFKGETAELKNKLAWFGVSCFVAHEDIEPEKEWQEEIEVALGSMHAFAALLTADFHKSKWTDQEVGFAYARRVPFISVRLEIDPYGFMGKFQAVRSDWSKCAGDIGKRLIKNERMLVAFIKATRKVPSNWNIGRMIGEVLPEIDHLTANQIDEFVAAYNETEQLRHSFAFNGEKPPYGKGLVHHLNRLGQRKFKFEKPSGLIRMVS